MLKDIKPLLWSLAALAVVGTGWRYRNAEVVRQWLHTPTQARPVKFDNDTPRGTEVAKLTEPLTAPDGVRKCVRDHVAPVYTERECPSGTRETGLRNKDMVNVMPSDHPAPLQARANLPNARELLTPADSKTPKDMLLDRAVNH